MAESGTEITHRAVPELGTLGTVPRATLCGWHAFAPPSPAQPTGPTAILARTTPCSGAGCATPTAAGPPRRGMRLSADSPRNHSSPGPDRRCPSSAPSSTRSVGTRDSRGAVDGPNRPDTDSQETASDRQGDDLVRARAPPRGEATRGAACLIGGPPYQRTEYFAERANAPAASTRTRALRWVRLRCSRSAPRSPSPARSGNSANNPRSAARSQRCARCRGPTTAQSAISFIPLCQPGARQVEYLIR
jgi:hypothetical protein